MLKKAFFKAFVAVPAKRFIKRHGIEALGKRNMKNLLEGMNEKGSPTDSMFLWPVKALSKKLLGNKHDRIGRSINKAIFDADTIAGKPLDAITKNLSITKNLFKQEEMIPVGVNRYKKIMRTSITAPIGDMGKIVMPMAASSYVYDKLKKKEDQGGTV